MNQKHRPFGITLLAILAGFAALIAIVHTLQMLDLLPIPGPLGQVVFFTFDPGGAILWGMLAFIYIWVFRMLWAVNPQGWLFLVLLSILDLIVAFVSILGQSSWQAMAPTILLNGFILIYCLLPGTKAAFQVEQIKQPAPKPVTAPMREPAAPKPTPESAPTLVENVDIAAETAVVAATIPTIQKTEPTPAPVVEDVAQMATVVAVVEEVEYIEDDFPEIEVEEIEVVAAVVENVDIEMETAVAAAAIAAKEPVEEAEEVQEAEKPAPTAADLIAEVAQASPGTSAKLSADTEFIEGIGPVYSQKLKEAGIETPQTLLEKGASRQGRQDLAEETGISSKLILTWIHAVDLYRIKGVGAEYADLLDKAGVNTVLELAQRNPENLHQKLLQVNLEKHLVREVPSLNQVKDWVEQAAALPRVISY